MNQVATVQQPTAVARISDGDLIQAMESSLYPGANPKSIALVLTYCRARNLDPMMKPVHIVPMYVKDALSGKGAMRDVIMPGIYSYRIDAARTNEYVGKSEPEFGPPISTVLNGVEITFPEWCKITVYRLKGGKERAFTAKELWLENYATAGRDTAAPNAMWRKRPYGQLSKIAEAQALRMAFPEAVSNQPTDDEMEGKSIEHEATAAISPPAPPPPPPPPAEAAPPPPQGDAPEEWSFPDYITRVDAALGHVDTEEGLQTAWKAREQPQRKLVAAEITELTGLRDKHKARIAALPVDGDFTEADNAPEVDPPAPPAPPAPPSDVRPEIQPGLLSAGQAKAKTGLKRFNMWINQLSPAQVQDLAPYVDELRSAAAQVRVDA